MKHTIIKVAIFSVLFTFQACSFLDEQPESFVSRDNFFKTENQCRSAVNSIYTQLRSVFVQANWIFTEGTTDIIYVPSTSDVNAIMDVSPSHCIYANTMWTGAYKMVMYANEAIQGISTSPLTQEKKDPLIAEATIMRAFWYYQLTCCFGDVPMYLQYVEDAEAMNTIAKLGRMSAVKTREQMINDINGVLSYLDDGTYTGTLPQVKASEIETGRAGWALGEMLVAKMALWNAYKDTSSVNWISVAQKALQRLEAVYGELGTYPLDDLYFRTKNTPEVIFEIQHVYNTAGLSYVSNLATICMPAKTGSNDSDIFDGVRIPEMGKDTKVGTCSRPTVYFCQALQPNLGIDKRAKINMAWDYNGTAFRSVSVRPWMGPKFWCPYMHQDLDYNNYPIFRYADAVLMMAECCYLLQDKTGFEKHINSVKERAGTETYNVQNWDRAFEELQEERARELFGEFQRKYDLVRWGIWYERVQEYTDWEILKLTMKPCHEYLPIPEKQVIYSGGALDNKEYNKYGL